MCLFFYCSLLPSHVLLAYIKAQLLQPRLHIRVTHKQIPKQSGAVVLYHDGNWALVDGEVAFRIPVVRFAECVVEAEGAEELVAHVVEVAHHLHGIFRGVDDGGQGGGGGDDAFVVLLVGGVGGVSVNGVAGGEPPAVGAEAFVVLRVADAVSTVH